MSADLTGIGQGADSVAVAPVLAPMMLLSPTGQVITTYQGEHGDPPISFTTSGAFGKVDGAR